MKAVYFEEFGGPEVLQFGDLPAPEPADGHLIVDVHHAGVNPIDWKARQGVYADMFEHRFPIVAGFDFSGTVRSVGKHVGGFEIGDRVHGMNPLDLVRHGTYAEVTRSPVTAVSKCPDDLSDETAAAIPTVALTAAQSLIDFGGLASGQSVLIQGGAGGVGTVAIQLSKALGATVLTTARADDHDYVRGLGADYIIDYEKQDFVEAARQYFPDGVDLVVDMIGGETLARGYRALRKGGRLAVLTGQPDPDLDREFEVDSAFVFTVPNAARLGEVAAMVVNGTVTLPEIRTFDLKDAKTAQIESASGSVRGKIVLRVQ